MRHPRPLHRIHKARQHGVVLIVAMIFLIVMSLLAVNSMRNSASTEALANNVRTGETAMQAAEMALRHCEAAVRFLVNEELGRAQDAFNTLGITFDHILPMVAQGQPFRWEQVNNVWDSTNPAIIGPQVLVLQGLVNPATFSRPPECLIERIAPDVAINNFVITVRAFGPEVEAVPNGATSRRPNGTEVWLQSSFTLE